MTPDRINRFGDVGLDWITLHRSKAMATFWKIDEAGRIVIPANGVVFSLEEQQRFVGGYIEHVHLDADSIMVVNEEGLLINLPINRAASEFYGRKIVGNVLVCSRKEAGYLT